MLETGLRTTNAAGEATRRLLEAVHLADHQRLTVASGTDLPVHAGPLDLAPVVGPAVDHAVHPDLGETAELEDGWRGAVLRDLRRRTYASQNREIDIQLLDRDRTGCDVQVPDGRAHV